jgi:hypothetical protein
VLTEAEVIEAEEELKALQRHAFAIESQNGNLESSNCRRWISASDRI